MRLPATGARAFGKFGGKGVSRGIEFDLAGEIRPGWRVIASYAYDETEVVSDTTFPVDQPLSNVPRHSGSIWTTYRLQTGRLKGLGFGVGEYYVGQREANLPNTYDLAAYWRTDASVSYERRLAAPGERAQRLGPALLRGR